MSSDDVLLGLGLVLVLAVGAQLVARVLRLPAIVVLLPTAATASTPSPRPTCASSSGTSTSSGSRGTRTRRFLMPPALEPGLLPSYDELAQAFAEGARVTVEEAAGGALELRFVR